MTPTVSVIIPTHNRAEPLMRAVRSCLEQARPVLEVLVCADGCTDDSRARIAGMGDARVRWIDGPAAGRPAVPRNRGLHEALGDWIAFLDDDDSWEPGKLSTQLARLEGHDALAVSTNALRVRPDGKAPTPYFTAMPKESGLAELLTENHVICSSMLARRDAVLAAGGFPESPGLRAAEDYALWLRMAQRTRVLHCPEPLVRYNDAPDQSIRSQWSDAHRLRDAVLTDLLDWDNGQAFTAAQRRLIRRHLRKARRAAGRPLPDWLFLR
ncbi:MAG: glycosyltransferase family 2 protein [Flavobacteriales bacterium]|nr:glycosyltransferase family 2 protein [Flavobacteriales bacterium]